MAQCVWTVGGRRFITAGERGNTRAAWRFPTACNSNLAKIQQICFGAKEPPPPHGWSHSTRSPRGEISLGSSTGASSPPSPTRCPNVRQMRKHSRLSPLPRQIALYSSRLYNAVLGVWHRTTRHITRFRSALLSLSVIVPTSIGSPTHPRVGCLTEPHGSSHSTRSPSGKSVSRLIHRRVIASHKVHKCATMAK